MVFMVFNRPDKTRRVFEAIKKARPAKLLIISDGPRNAEDEVTCREVRELIETGVDWPCEIFKNYADKNLGCKDRISSGLDWAFSQVEEAIILEDDCLPDPSFFPFCVELLEKYRHNDNIMSISGYNMAVLNSRFNYDESYYFSNIGLICGWATWRRAWKHYDVNIGNWPEIKRSGLLKKVLKDDVIVNHYNHLFDDYYVQRVDSWDSQWFLSRWLNRGISIVSANNLITNIGFDTEGAHHAIDPNDPRAHVPVVPITFPLIHPNRVTVYKKADDYTFKHYMGINLLWSQRWRWWLKSNFPNLHSLLKKLR
ncbi:MAG: hemolytic protein HlpA-like protein [Candidatus Yanofskybacteria bacterium CG10_big_fil_rev_8_21_14_0_10_46_23]|uniref:Hemolytic protein HlpA-like protein n=1 Tax=Candidatus Yanofskybacteria bacterium CG10_big_fil_rev_8_21_14_0_10_46_23 TaxID=1975098 RepID=A0A2H0R731_9BACT|nr:MAG: hemolytic protein HlpA-like protein [Candidatus Yanofskybacteria bacterium CG10_big_fil_rev_8_21_14_0_10_46_23]